VSSSSSSSSSGFYLLISGHNRGGRRRRRGWGYVQHRCAPPLPTYLGLQLCPSTAHLPRPTAPYTPAMTLQGASGITPGWAVVCTKCPPPPPSRGGVGGRRRSTPWAVVW